MFVFIPSRGLAGGIIIGWNGLLLKRLVVYLGTFCLTVEFLRLKDNFLWLCTSVYRLNSRSLKQSFWDEIRTCNGAISLPWVICGDFNAIFYIQDKMSGIPNLEDIHSAHVLIGDLNLIEPPTFGRMFTWTNGQVEPTWVRLDRFQVNSDLTSHFPKVIQICLPWLSSDHVLIQSESGLHISKPRPFHFELAWYSTDGFGELIQTWWNELSPSGCGAFILSKKIAWLRDRLRHWAKACFKSIKLRKLAFFHELETLDIAKESR